jgi:acyl-CoA thioesterase FadM
MNLYLRLLWTLLRSFRLPTIAMGAMLTRSLRVMPNDLDVNGHMNNGRYMTVVDLLLVEYFVRSGFARVLVRRGWRPMAGGSFITYRRGLKPLQRYEVRFRQEGADAHWNYMRFEFVAEDGTLCAAGYMKGAAVGRSGLVPNEQSYASLGLPFAPAALPEPVRHWLAAEGSVMATAGRVG